MPDTTGVQMVPQLTIVVPTFNEKANIRPLVTKLTAALGDIAWEVVFVDDDSPDGTAKEVRALGRENANVRVIHRIGRRGLAGACIEGILSSAARLVAVMDGDMQHDETRLPVMYEKFRQDAALDLVIGSRNVDDGSAGTGLSATRKVGSDFANTLATRLLKITASDPMSGFFMIRRQSFTAVVMSLQQQGFKILADMLSASRGTWKIAEVGYVFRERRYGESKLDSAVTMEYLGLLAVRLTGGLMSIRFILFGMVGVTGVVVHLSILRGGLALWPDLFIMAQTLAVITAMTTNFMMNNVLTYKDRSLKGFRFFTGLISFYGVCSVGAIANVGVATLIFGAFPHWAVAGIFGAIVGAFWNFFASSLVTWKA